MDLELNEKLMGVNNLVQVCVECRKLWNQNWRNFVKVLEVMILNTLRSLVILAFLFHFESIKALNC